MPAATVFPWKAPAWGWTGSSARRSWNQIYSTGLKRMAASQTLDAHPAAALYAIPFHRLAHIFGTGWMIAAGGGKPRRQKSLIQPQRGDYELLQRRKTFSTSRIRSAKGEPIAARRGLKIISHSGFSRSSRWRTASRTRLLIRLRTTAPPSDRGSVKPIRGPGGPSASSRRAQNAANNGLE